MNLALGDILLHDLEVVLPGLNSRGEGSVFSHHLYSAIGFVGGAELKARALL